MSPIRGRCSCGFILDWVAQAPDAHLPCHGLRWCGRCGDAAPYKGNCAACHREDSRNYWRRQRRLLSSSAAYERNKAPKRWKYSTDPRYAEAKKADWRQRWQARRVAA